MSGNKAIILYIEDNPDNRKLVTRILGASGYTVHTANDGAAGLAYVTENIPDLILVDLQLPEIDGLTVTRTLRTMEGLQNVPIVALTANVLREDREQSIAAGCNGFIQKPISVDQLPLQVESYLTPTREPK